MLSGSNLNSFLSDKHTTAPIASTIPIKYQNGYACTKGERSNGEMEICFNQIYNGTKILTEPSKNMDVLKLTCFNLSTQQQKSWKRL